MIIGMFIKQREKHIKLEINQLKELNDKLKKRNQALMEEIEALKKLLENYENKEEEKKEENKDENTQIKVETIKKGRIEKYTARSSSQGYVRVIRRNNEPVNVVETTMKISYKRRNEQPKA